MPGPPDPPTEPVLSIVAAHPADPALPPVTMIRPRRGWRSLDLGGAWRCRELGLALAGRDLRVRYKQTALGAAWALVQPLATMLVLHVFFGRALGMAGRVGDVPYPVFLYAGLLPWTLFTAAVTASATSLVSNGHILSKVYFPRLLLPISATLPPLADYALASVVLVGMMAWYGLGANAAMLLLPALVLSTLLAVLGVGILLASITVVYRDVRHVLPFLLQTWFFVTPVIYPTTLLPDRYAWLLALNPMAGIIEAFRAAILGTPIDYAAWATSTAVAAGMLLIGLIWFANVERRFADIV